MSARANQPLPTSPFAAAGEWRRNRVVRAIAGGEVEKILAEHRRYLATDRKQGARANFSSADLREMRFAGMKLRRARFDHAQLAGANFMHADLSKANLIGADLRGASLPGADLTQARLSGANLACANLEGACL